MDKDKVVYLKHDKVKDRDDCIVILAIPLDYLCFITPPARWAWRSYKFTACFFFGCRKLGYRSWVIPLYNEPHGFKLNYLRGASSDSINRKRMKRVDI